MPTLGVLARDVEPDRAGSGPGVTGGGDVEPGEGRRDLRPEHARPAGPISQSQTHSWRKGEDHDRIELCDPHSVFLAPTVGVALPALRNGRYCPATLALAAHAAGPSRPSSRPMNPRL